MNRGGTAGGKGEAGLAGLEAIAFGLLVCVGVTMAVLHGWAVVDAASTARAAAREAARVAAATIGEPDKSGGITAAAVATVRALGHPGHVDVAVDMDAATPRCSHVRVVVDLEVASPIRTTSATTTATAVRLVDPYRDGLAVTHDRPPCA